MARLAPLLALAALAPALGGLGGCVPYAVGATPATAAPRAVEASLFLQAVSARRDIGADDAPEAVGFQVGNEARLGLDDRSDVGVRLIGLGSLTATYKRRVRGAPGADRGASVVVGGGLIRASHLHLEATLVASPGPLAAAPEVVPYGGLRVQDLTPFADDALATAPAVGAFVGARFGWPDLGVSPEVGVFYSPTPGFGDGDVVVVPSVTVRGDRLRRALGI